MDKESIFRKDLTSHKDECETKVENKPFKSNWLIVSITLTSLLVFRVYQNEIIANLMIIVITHNLGLMLYQYNQKRELTTLISVTLLGLIGPGLGVTFVKCLWCV